MSIKALQEELASRSAQARTRTSRAPEQVVHAALVRAARRSEDRLPGITEVAKALTVRFVDDLGETGLGCYVDARREVVLTERFLHGHFTPAGRPHRGDHAELLHTLVHELVHAYDPTAGHTASFAWSAVLTNLEVVRDRVDPSRYDTRLGEEGLRVYADLIEELTKEL